MLQDKLPYLRRALGAELEASGAQALIAVSPEGFLHAAGVHVASQRMIRERLAFAVFVAGAEPFAVVSTVVVRTVRRDSWIDDVVAWAEHEETPIRGLARELRRRGLAEATIALELGYLPAASFAELQTELPEATWLDAEPSRARAWSRRPTRSPSCAATPWPPNVRSGPASCSRARGRPSARSRSAW
jgi:hypothetical protein